GGSRSGAACSVVRVCWNRFTCSRQLAHSITCRFAASISSAGSSSKMNSASFSVTCDMVTFFRSFSAQDRTQFLESHIQPRFHGGDRSGLDGGNLFEFQVLKDLQNYNFALILRQLLKRLFHGQTALYRRSRCPCFRFELHKGFPSILPELG